MNTQHDEIIDNNYDYMVGILNQLRKYDINQTTSACWSPNTVMVVLSIKYPYKSFSSNEVMWLSNNL